MRSWQRRCRDSQPCSCLETVPEVVFHGRVDCEPASERPLMDPFLAAAMTSSPGFLREPSACRARSTGSPRRSPSRRARTTRRIARAAGFRGPVPSAWWPGRHLGGSESRPRLAERRSRPFTGCGSTACSVAWMRSRERRSRENRRFSDRGKSPGGLFPRPVKGVHHSGRLGLDPAMARHPRERVGSSPRP